MLRLNYGSTEMPPVRRKTLEFCMHIEGREAFCCPCCGAQFELSNCISGNHINVTVEFAAFPKGEVGQEQLPPEVHEGIHAKKKGGG